VYVFLLYALDSLAAPFHIMPIYSFELHYACIYHLWYVTSLFVWMHLNAHHKFFYVANVPSGIGALFKWPTPGERIAVCSNQQMWPSITIHIFTLVRVYKDWMGQSAIILHSCWLVNTWKVCAHFCIFCVELDYASFSCCCSSAFDIFHKLATCVMNIIFLVKTHAAPLDPRAHM
jgi:hypothetical protein